MAFIAFGINYKTAPLSLREIIAQHLSARETHVSQLLQSTIFDEVFVLSTCNRTEWYAETTHADAFLPWLANEWQLPLTTLSSCFYRHEHEDAIRHTLRVASGVDSMMIGEPQILGQMKQAYTDAEQAGSIKQQLRAIFPYIFNASKHIRHQSGIGTNPISVASAAVRLMSQCLQNLAPLHVLIIGSGETASLVAKYLQQQGVSSFRVASRTPESAQKLASKLNGQAFSISDIPHQLPYVDVVISATACPLPFINKAMVEPALAIRQHAPMFFLDLAVPRDIEADVGELDAVHLYNIDDLHLAIEKGMIERRAAALLADQLIDDKIDDYHRWHRSQRANTVICDYRNHMQDLAQHELQRATQKLALGHCQYSVLSEFCERLVNKLTHMPTLGLRQAASDSRDELLDLARYLFNTASLDTSSHEKIT